MQDEQFMIQKIRQYGQDIFREDTFTSQDSSIDYSLSDSEFYIEERLEPFIKPLKPSKKKTSDQKLTHYVSPYSQRQMSSSQSRRSSINYDKSVKTASIRKKIFGIYEEHKEYEDKQKQTSKHFSKKKYSDLKPKYMQKQPLFNQMIERNLHERFKTQTMHQRKPSKMSREQSEEKWKNFHKKNSQWSQSKSNSLMKAKVMQNLKLKTEADKKQKRKSPPQMTVDDCLHKLRRHAQKLKQKLNEYSFSPVLYETERKKYKILKSRSRSKCRQNEQSPSGSPITKKQITKIKNPNRQLDFIFN